MDTRETPATKAADIAAQQRAPGDICAFVKLKTFLTQKEILSAHTGIYCLLLLNIKRHTQDLSEFFLEAQYGKGKPTS